MLPTFTRRENSHKAVKDGISDSASHSGAFGVLKLNYRYYIITGANDTE